MVQKNNTKKLDRLLKNKGLVIAGILPFLFWIIIFSVWFLNNQQDDKSGSFVVKKNQLQNNNTNISQILSIANSQIDADKDGLSDWEESLYGTDPKNPDTDEDGYLDGEEIISNRDPLKKGPDDFLKTGEKSNSNNSIKNISKIVIENYLKTIQSQGSIDLTPENLDQILTQSLSEEDSTTFNEALRSELYYFIPPNLDKEISISSDNSEKNIKKYWADMGKSFEKLFKNAPSYDFFQLIKSSMQTKDYKKLDEVMLYYKNSYENVKMISVPSSLLDAHKNMMLVFYKHWKILEAIKTYEDDPMRSLLAINELTKIFQNNTK